ncbi:hypothetical protein SAMN05660282_01482 [Corynebacterium spheniscorum]|uniref:Uncharacterized protein n=1 Tax=Corynebacterium spheniscorum TaxID=185761 RepID=A0A1I2TMM9_9CORY|nr:hypothetical protein SAMN05660282_01482 [Corynebacterium spheniscorum]
MGLILMSFIKDQGSAPRARVNPRSLPFMRKALTLGVSEARLVMGIKGSE